MAEIFSLEYPQSLGVFDKYADAQKAVDFLSDHEFPVENVLIVGTELKQVERVTGRLTWGKVISAGAASGAWLGLLIGAVLSIFSEGSSAIVTILGGIAFGIAFGVISGALGYGATRGQRDHVDRGGAEFRGDREHRGRGGDAGRRGDLGERGEPAARGAHREVGARAQC